MRHLVLVIAALLLTGCGDTVTLQNPRTGEAVACGGPGWELNPWSQHDACVSGHIAQGWTIVR